MLSLLRSSNVILEYSLLPICRSSGALFLTSIYGGKDTWIRPNGIPLASQTAEVIMIRKLKSGEYRLYSKKKDPKTGKRRNLGTFDTREAAEKHERDVQYFKRH